MKFSLILDLRSRNYGKLIGCLAVLFWCFFNLWAVLRAFGVDFVGVLKQI